jgi:hypothetical protein
MLNGVVRIVDPITGKLLLRVKALADVRSLAFSPDGKELAIADMSGIRLISLLPPMSSSDGQLRGSIATIRYRPKGLMAISVAPYRLK